MNFIDYLDECYAGYWSIAVAASHNLKKCSCIRKIKRLSVLLKPRIKSSRKSFR